MGELTTYFGCDTIRTFFDEASDNINKFSAQNAATKAELADDWKVKTVIYKRSIQNITWYSWYSTSTTWN